MSTPPPPHLTCMTDSELVEQILDSRQKGDWTREMMATKVLYQKHAPFQCTLASRRLARMLGLSGEALRHDANACFADAFVETLKRLPSISREDRPGKPWSIGPYLHEVTRCNCIRLWKKVRREEHIRRSAERMGAGLLVEKHASNLGATTAFVQQVRSRIPAVLEGLRQQELDLLKALGSVSRRNRSEGEVAARMGISVVAIRQRLSRAWKALRSQVRDVLTLQNHDEIELACQICLESIQDEEEQ